MTVFCAELVAPVGPKPVKIVEEGEARAVTVNVAEEEGRGRRKVLVITKNVVRCA